MRKISAILSEKAYSKHIKFFETTTKDRTDIPYLDNFILTEEAYRIRLRREERKMANIIYETVRGIDRVSIEDEMLKNRKIFFVEEVNEKSTNELIKQLMYLEQAECGEEITLYINSPGGEVTSGLAVYDVIRLMESPVNTVCIGTAASMGAILFLSGKRRGMLPHTRLMIHDPSYGSGNFGGKKSHEIQHELDKLNETREALAEIIAEKTGKSMDEIYQVTAEDTYYSAKEALGFGLATEIITDAGGLRT